MTPTPAHGEASEELTWKTLGPRELVTILTTHEKFVTGIPGGRRALLAHHQLENADFSGRNLTEIDLVGAKLAGTRFNKA